MSNTPHELAEEFPDHVNTIHDLRLSNQHFARLSDEYHQINRAIHRAETDIEPTTDDHMNAMRRQRMALKDEIYSILTKGA